MFQRGFLLKSLGSPRAPGMNSKEMQDLLAAHADRGEYVARCVGALSDKAVRSLGIGRMSARDALGVWSIRLESLSEAHVVAAGLPEALRALGEMGHSQPVLLHVFETQREFVGVFVSGRDGSFIGCFVKPQRGTPGGGPSVPPLGPEFGGPDRE